MAYVVNVTHRAERDLAFLYDEIDAEHSDAALGWLAALALYGGLAVFLLGRFTFLQLTVGSSRLAPLAGAGLIVLLLPVAASVPALAALGLLCAVVAAVTAFDHYARERT